MHPALDPERIFGGKAQAACGGARAEAMGGMSVGRPAWMSRPVRLRGSVTKDRSFIEPVQGGRSRRRLMEFDDDRGYEVDLSAYEPDELRAIIRASRALLEEKGSGLRDVQTLHRIDAEVVKEEILAGGFVLDGESDILRHPKDDRTINVFDDAIRGRTDRFI